MTIPARAPSRILVAVLGVSAALLLSVICGCEKESDSSDFTFLVLSDTHVHVPGSGNQENLDNFDYMVDRINRDYTDAAFVVFTGDLVNNLQSDDPDDYLIGTRNPAEEFLGFVSRLYIPWHVALGNHDYHEGYDHELHSGITTDSPESIEAVWEKVLGKPSFYSFVFGRWRFIILNSCRGEASRASCFGSRPEAMCTGSFDDDQLDWLENLLQNPEPCMLFFHHPVISDNNIESAWTYGQGQYQVAAGDRFYEIAARYRQRIKAIFVGHGHTWTRDTLHGVIPVYETGAIGNASNDKDNVHIVTVQWDGDSYQVEPGNPNAEYVH